jgi:hypothetical protein
MNQIAADETVGRRRRVKWRLYLRLTAGALMVLLLAQALGYSRLPRLQSDTLATGTEELEMTRREEAPAVDDYLKAVTGGCFGLKGKPPKPQLFGILGDSALIGQSQGNADFFVVGADLPGGFKLVEVQANAVVIERDGSKETLTLFGDLGDGLKVVPPPDAGSGEPVAPGDSDAGAPPDEPGAVIDRGSGAPATGGDGAGILELDVTRSRQLTRATGEERQGDAARASVTMESRRGGR